MLRAPLVHPRDLLAPAGELRALGGAVLAQVHRVVHDAAEGVTGVDGLALGAGQAEERVEEVRAALAGEAGDELARVHRGLIGLLLQALQLRGPRNGPRTPPIPVGALIVRSVPHTSAGTQPCPAAHPAHVAVRFLRLAFT